MEVRTESICCQKQAAKKRDKNVINLQENQLVISLNSKIDLNNQVHF